MAVTNQKSIQVNNMDQNPPVIEETTDISGKVRIIYFEHTQVGAGDAGSSIEVGRLPRGEVRILGSISSVKHNWTTASQTMDVGWDSYTDFEGNAVTADPNGLDDAISVDTAGTITVCTELNNGTKIFRSADGVSIRLTGGAALVAGDTVAGYIMYVLG
ncbi:MAG: hypothetical protein NZ824_12265 [Candidatus Thioglobus sp.]|nr:hypothetical protein [Candidatus Thioglobus sp.]